MPHLIKLEKENFSRSGAGRVELHCLAISPKRYALFEVGPEGETIVRKRSRHGLGLFMPPLKPEEPGLLDQTDEAPEDWVAIVWRRIVDEVRGTDAGPLPEWFDTLAPSQDSITRWSQLHPYRNLNQRRRYSQRIKPANFLLVAHDDPLVALPVGFNRSQLTPIAPYASEPSEWLNLPWRNRFDARPLRLTTRSHGALGRVRVRTYGDVVKDYRLHPDPKSAASDGSPVRRGTIGVLSRRLVLTRGIRYVGKETARRIDEQSGMLRLGDEAFTTYTDNAAEWHQVRDELRRCRDARTVTVSEMASASGLSTRALQYALNRGTMPRSARAREALAQVATHCRATTRTHVLP